MDNFNFYKRRFRLEDGELWHRIDGFYGYPAFAVEAGLYEKRRRVREVTGVLPDFATFVAEHGVLPLLTPYVEGEVKLIKAERGPVWARGDDPDAHYFKVYIKEGADYERLKTRTVDLDWLDFDDE
jgi:hypothetical protein